MELKSLYEIEKDYLNIIQSLEENEGELTRELDEQIKLNKENLEKKSLAYIEYIKDREFYIEKIDAELKRLTLIKARQQTIIDKLKSNLKEAVKTFGEIKTGLYKITTYPSYSLEITNENILPKEFYTEEEIKVKHIDKNAIKKVMKDSNIEISGAKLNINQNLKIK